MILGVICIGLGLWIWAKLLRSVRPNDKQLDTIVEWYQTQLNDRENTIKTLEIKLREKNQNRDLDAKILQDAIHRENRAKGALEAVLKTTHATRAQIDHVLREVDGSEGSIDGD